MGCGQSKILIYHRKSRADKNSRNNWAGDDSEPSDSHPEEGGRGGTGTSERLPEQPEPERQDSTETEAAPSLLEQSDISTSQIDFFKMLDEKIENGPDYEEDELEREQERQRLRRLLQDWLRRPAVDTQRFPTAYQPCPPTRPPARVCPRPSFYPQPRAYIHNRAVSVEGGEYWDPYTDTQYSSPWIDPRLRGDSQEMYSNQSVESHLHYPRMTVAATQYGPSIDQDMYARNRPLLGKTGGRAISFDSNIYSRGPSIENQDSYTVVSGNEYIPRGRELNYTQYSPYMPASDNAAVGYPSGLEQVQYIARPPPREMPPLQGVPGPPHGSPRPLSVRLPASAMWRRPRGPVTESV